MDTISLVTRNKHPMSLDAFALVCLHAGVWFDRVELAERLGWTRRRLSSAIHDLACARMLLVAVPRKGQPPLYAIPQR